MATSKKTITPKPTALPTATVAMGNEVQQLYADAPVELGIGPFVSRVAFGTQVSGTEVQRQFQLVMPSNALLNLAETIISTFAKEGQTGRLQSAHNKFIEKVRTDEE